MSVKRVTKKTAQNQSRAKIAFDQWWAKWHLEYQNAPSQELAAWYSWVAAIEFAAPKAKAIWD